MAMDPKKLAAFAGGGGGQGGGPPPTDEDFDDTGLDEQDEDEDEDEDEDYLKENGDGRFGQLIPVLEEFADDIESLSEELDPDVLDDMTAEMPPDEEQILKDGLQTLDGKLIDEMKKAFSGGITPEEAEGLAEHLVEEDILDDAGRIAGWLYRVSTAI